MDQKKKHQGHVSVNVKNVDLINLRQQDKYMEHEGKYDKNGRKILLDPLKVIGISGRDGVPNYRGIFQIGPD
jgi:hypothetical protein